MNPLDLRHIAVLVDVDGTLLDIAPTPEAVRAPASLTATLERLLELTGGALALVSGRPIADLDRILSPLRLPAIGGHGAEIRRRPDAPPERRHAGALDDALKQRLKRIAAGKAGVIAEDKGYSLALHFRQAPEHEQAVREAVAAVCAERPADSLERLEGKAVIEIKEAAFNKGTAVRELMQHPPFRGRRPVFVGDDVTDESVFRVLPEFDGLGFSVGHRLPGLAGAFASPGEVRRWLSRMIDDRAVPEP